MVLPPGLRNTPFQKFGGFLLMTAPCRKITNWLFYDFLNVFHAGSSCVHQIEYAASYFKEFHMNGENQSIPCLGLVLALPTYATCRPLTCPSVGQKGNQRNAKR